MMNWNNDESEDDEMDQEKLTVLSKSHPGMNRNSLLHG